MRFFRTTALLPAAAAALVMVAGVLGGCSKDQTEATAQTGAVAPAAAPSVSPEVQAQINETQKADAARHAALAAGANGGAAPTQ